MSVAGTKVLTLLIGLATTPILYRLLEPSGVGVYTTVLSVFSLFMIFVSSGVTDGVRKFLAEERDMECWEEHVVGFYFRLALVLSVGGAVLVVLATWAGVVARVYEPKYEPYFYILAGLTIVSQFRAYARRTLMGFGLERYSEPLKVVQQVTFVVVALPLVHFGFDVEGALAGKIAAAAVVAVIGVLLIRRQISLGAVFRSTPEQFPRRTMLTFNTLSIVLILFLMSLYHVDILMLGSMASSKQVGYYRAALKLVEFLWFVPLALQTVFVHSASEMWSNGRTERISKLAARTTRYTFLLTGVMALGLGALAEVAVPTYFGGNYTPAITPLLLLLPGTLGFAVARPILAISQGKGDLKYPIIATGTAAGMNLVLNALLIPRYGMHGAAVATSIGYGSMFVFHLWSARRIGFDPLSDARLGRTLVTTVFAAPPIFVLAHLFDIRPLVFGFELPLSLVIVPPVGFIVFLFFAFVTGALEVCEVLNTLSSLPEPLGSTAETLRTTVNERSMSSEPMSSESMQKAMVVVGILLFISGIGFAFLSPDLGSLDNLGDDTNQPPMNTTQSPDTDTGTTEDPGTTGGTTTTEEPDGTTVPPPETSTTEPPSTTEEPSTTETTTEEPTTTPGPTTSTTSEEPTTSTTSEEPTTGTTTEETTSTDTTSTTSTTSSTTTTTTTTTTEDGGLLDSNGEPTDVGATTGSTETGRTETGTEGTSTDGTDNGTFNLSLPSN